MKMISKQNLIVLLGNALEYYDFMLYGFFAVILAPLFFPHDNPSLSLIASMGSYGVGFLARPFGAIIFGHLGDKWGRKDALSFSILLVAFPTLGIALLPTYELIGLWAPLLLICCRLLQGVCLGGESGGVVTYIIENSSPHQKDITSAWGVLSCYVGTLVGTLLGAFFTLPVMPTWGWRLTFVMGSFIAVIGYYIRRNLRESPDFLRVREKGKILKLPLQELFKKEKLSLFYTFSLASAIIIPFFVVFIYLNGLFVKKLQLETSTVLFLNAGLMIFWITFLLFFGFLAQKVGRKVVMKGGLLGLALFSFPLFFMLGEAPSLAYIIIAQLCLSLFAMAFAAPSSAFLVELFPVNQRYSGIAIGYSLGHAFFGGLTPILLTTLVSVGFSFAPVGFLLFSSFMGFIALHETSFSLKRPPRDEGLITSISP